MVESKKKRPGSAAATPNTPQEWTLEGVSESAARVRNLSPAPSLSGPRTTSIRPSNPRRTSTMDVLPSEGRYSESAESTGTVRRVGADSDNRDADDQADHSERRQLQSRGSSTGSSLRGRLINPENSKRPRKPAMSRRGSAVPVSHHGKPLPGFSVDDNESEVEEDLHNQRLSSALGTTGFAPMRRHSLLRRRTNTAQGTLDRGDDDDREVREAVSTSESEDSDTNDEEEDYTIRGRRSYEPSDADSIESFTLKERQQAINETHPFGIRIWKPALYKKNRSVQRTAEGDIHSAPGGSVSKLQSVANFLWVILFGWWLSLSCLIGGLICYLFLCVESARVYGNVLFGLAWYIFYPFGCFVELKQEQEYMEEDEGEGRSISEYEQWQAGDLEVGRTFFGPHTHRSLIGRRRESIVSASETDSLLGGADRRGYSTQETEQPSPRGRPKRRFFGRGEWNVGRIVFYICFYCLVAPLLLLVSGICWWLVFTIPMAKVTSLLLSHLRRHPLALSFHSDQSYNRPEHATILLCTYRAVGWKYYKYTIDGTNIFFINLMSLVFFVILDYYLFAEYMHLKSFITHPAVIFTLSLFSVIPLAYFIGQAVASISAQSSMGMGATINAFFSTIVEVFLYCVALSEGKARLVEGSIVGSILAGILLMPGISMCSGAIKRKTQRFNSNSAGVTATMLLFAVIGAFAPTMFYQIYGTYELSCSACHGRADEEDCRRCIFAQRPSIVDSFFRDAVLPFSYLASFFLFVSYVIGLLFTLRTHAAMIWQVPAATAIVSQHHIGQTVNTVLQQHQQQQLQQQQQQQLQQQLQPQLKQPQREQEYSGAQSSYDGDTARANSTLRDSQLYKRILGQGLSGAGRKTDGAQNPPMTPTGAQPQPGQPIPIVPQRTEGGDGATLEYPQFSFPGLSSEQNTKLARGVAQVAAATATAVAAAAVQDAHRQQQQQRKGPHQNVITDLPRISQATVTTPGFEPDVPFGVAPDGGFHEHGGHDAPNWSKHKSAFILLSATILYAVIAEILVKTVDVVLTSIDIDEKFLGITLFALVPNTTEFLNAISFAMNGNISLSMEIGSAYALQVCLLQIPALVAWSTYAMNTLPIDKVFSHSFILLFPQWDLVTVILCVFLLSYIYAEGKSNYFKGCIMLLSYLTVMLGFYFSSHVDTAVSRSNGVDYKVVGGGSRVHGIVFTLPP